jgi:UDP-glucose 4-epimerase
VIDIAPRWRNPAARYHELDLFDDAGLAGALAGCAAVFHLAGASDVNDVAADPVGAVRLNVEGTARVLEAARQQQCERVLLASTVWVYGATVGDGERTEEAPVDLAQARARLRGDQAGGRTARAQLPGDVRAALHDPALRHPVRAADAGRAGRRPVRRAALAGEPITIAGTGEQQRNYVFVGDIADAHVRALSPAAADQVLALEGGTPVSVREIADTVTELIRPVPIEHMPARTADYQGVGVSNRRAKEVLDWSPQTSFAVGVRRYLDWLTTDSEGAPGRGGTAGARGTQGALMRRALLLSGSLGAGHEVHARTFASSLAGAAGPPRFWMRCGCSARAAGPRVRRCSAACWRYPACFDAFHFARCGPGAGSRCSRTRPRAGSSCRGFVTTSMPIPADLAVSVFATASSAVSVLADRYRA